MLKYIFALIILVHGLIHFMGFSKAFGYGNITQLTKYISKPAGMVWFITALLFSITVILFLLKKDSWPLLALIAAVMSQVLIFMVWKDAKFGTIANIIVLLVAIPSFSNVQFNKMVNKEATELLQQSLEAKTIITQEMLTGLPPVVQKWLIHSGVIGKEKIQFVRLKQKGEMRTKPDGKWMPFTATQYFTVNEPQFVWKTDVNVMPLISMAGRDKIVQGEGEMVIKLLSLFEVAKVTGSDKINLAAMIRYMAETTWFPTAALNDYMKWETIDSSSAKMSMTYKGITVSGVMKFTDEGDMKSFEADRYKDNGKKAASLEKWVVEVTGYKEFQGMRIPYKNKVTWRLKEGDFNWANIELMDLEFNNAALYK